MSDEHQRAIDAALAEGVIDRKTVDGMTREGASREYIVGFIGRLRDIQDINEEIETAIEDMDRDMGESHKEITKQLDDLQLDMSSPVTRPFKRVWFSLRNRFGS
jgi:hypothetical protein